MNVLASLPLTKETGFDVCASMSVFYIKSMKNTAFLAVQ